VYDYIQTGRRLFCAWQTGCHRPVQERETSGVRGVLPLTSLCELRLPPLLHNVFVLRIEKDAMLNVLHREHVFSDLFVAYIVGRYNRTQADLVDQLFNSAEKRLARILLLLARFGKEEGSENVVPKISQETLAEMVGTTRARINFFMNRFRQLGLIDYNGGLEVHSSLLAIVLHE
jgi:Crp-like helix-turn-helix domain